MIFSRRIFLLAFVVSTFVFLAVSVYGVMELVENAFGANIPIGSTFTNVYWPDPPYFAQPVSYLVISGTVAAYTGLNLFESRIAKFPKWFLSSLELFGMVLAVWSGYEIFYNFMIWGAIYSASAAVSHGVFPSPDVLSSTYPVVENLVFASKTFYALTFVSGYLVYFLKKLQIKS